MPADLPGPHAAVLRTAWMFRGGQSVRAGDIEHVTRLVEQEGVADTVALRLSAAVVLTAVTAVEPNRPGQCRLPTTRSSC